MRFTELFETPLPDDWDKSKFSRGTSFAKMVAYAKERAIQVGKGSSRVAFEIQYEGRKTVLKVALNSKGLAQNTEEANILEDYYVANSNIVIPMIDYDTDNGDRISWIHTEFANKITQKQLEKFFGGVSLERVIESIEYEKTGRRQRTWIDIDLPQETYDSEAYDDLRDILLSFPEIHGADLVRKANWGLYKGNPVIIDLGFTVNTASLYGF